jgi:hypothetical protein
VLSHFFDLFNAFPVSSTSLRQKNSDKQEPLANKNGTINAKQQQSKKNQKSFTKDILLAFSSFHYNSMGKNKGRRLSCPYHLFPPEGLSV